MICILVGPSLAFVAPSQWLRLAIASLQMRNLVAWLGPVAHASWAVVAHTSTTGLLCLPVAWWHCLASSSLHPSIGPLVLLTGLPLDDFVDFLLVKAVL